MPDPATIADLGIAFLSLLVVVVTLLVTVCLHIAYSFRWIGRHETKVDGIEQEMRREIPSLRDSRHRLANAIGKVEGRVIGLEDRLKRIEERADQRLRDRGL